ncbi:MAG TPA: hypothetical protein VJ974_06690 [Geopsychrobacteraceae bacterium]|nr:hypothetical protein [Geopsychrobacteraceae bacterium]
MESIRFADVLLILLISIVTFGILMLVNRKRPGSDKTEGDEKKNKLQSSDKDN